MFFLFKQKTAYEMRMSYWSSDVCSSDLVLPCASSSSGRRALPVPCVNPPWTGLAAEHPLDPGSIARSDAGLPCETTLPLGSLLLEDVVVVEIGRASCRERGCQ